MRGVVTRFGLHQLQATAVRPLRLARCFAGTAVPPLDPADKLPDSQIARDIIFKNKMSYLRDKLVADTRFRLPMSEFQEWLAANEVPQEEGIPFLKALHTAGLVLYYPYRSPDWIYLRPRAITRELLNLLDPDAEIASALMRNKTANLEKLEAEYATLLKQKAELDAQAARSGDRMTQIVMGSVVAQFFLFGRLIFWDLSWDVMEPVAYITAFSYGTLGWAWYTIARADIAEYGTIAGRYVSGKSLKLYEQNNFSLAHFQAVEQEILEHQNTLKAYGVDRLKKRPYPIQCTPAIAFETETPAEAVAGGENLNAAVSKI